MQRIAIALSLSLLFIGCSERQIYDGIQTNRESRCYDLPQGPQRDTCLAEARGMNYDQYQRELEKTR